MSPMKRKIVAPAILALSAAGAVAPAVLTVTAAPAAVVAAPAHAAKPDYLFHG